MPTTLIEDDILALRQQIKDKEADEARSRAAADQILEEAKEAGTKRFTKEWVDKVDDAFKESDALRDDLAGMRTHLERMLSRAAGGTKSNSTSIPAGTSRARATTVEALIARSFVESDSYKRASELAGTGARVETDPAPILDRAALRSWLQNPSMRAAFDENVGGALIPIDQQVYPPVEIPVRKVRLMDLITIGETNSDIVKWSFQTTRQDAAAPTPYGVPAPEAAFAYQPVQTTVQRLPVFVPVTKDQLADQAQTQTLLENQLRSDVERQLEYQVLAGNPGAGGMFLGILNGLIQGVSILSYARATTGGPAYMPNPPSGPEYSLDAIHKGITLVRLNLFDDPTVVGLHPSNEEVVALQKDLYGHYLIDPGRDENLTIWGLPTVVTPVFPVGTGLVADLKRGFTMWLRTGLQVFASDGYLDFFTRGMVAILAEMRAAGTVTQPRAICTVTGL